MERTNKHSTGKDDDLTSKQIFILQLGRINLPQYARNEFLTVIHGVCVRGGWGVATQTVTAIVKRNQSNKNTVHTCRCHTACVNKICIPESGEVFSLRKDGKIAT